MEIWSNSSKNIKAFHLSEQTSSSGENSFMILSRLDLVIYQGFAENSLRSEREKENDIHFRDYNCNFPLLNDKKSNKLQLWKLVFLSAKKKNASFLIYIFSIRFWLNNFPPGRKKLTNLSLNNYHQDSGWISDARNVRFFISLVFLNRNFSYLSGSSLFDIRQRIFLPAKKIATEK